MTIESNEQTATTGVYVGSITDQPVWYVYDKKTTDAYNQDKTYFFRYFSMPSDGLDSCMMFTMTGMDDGLVMFQNSGEVWTASVPDFAVTAEKS